MRSNTLSWKTDCLLRQAGFLPGSKGFLYLHRAILIFEKNPGYYQSKVYQLTGLFYHKNFSTIHDKINHTVSLARRQPNPFFSQLLNEFFAATSVNLEEGFTFIRAAVFWLNRYELIPSGFCYEWLLLEEKMIGRKNIFLMDCKHNLLSPYAAKQSDIFDEKHNLLSAHFQKGKKSRPKIS